MTYVSSFADSAFNAEESGAAASILSRTMLSAARQSGSGNIDSNAASIATADISMCFIIVGDYFTSGRTTPSLRKREVSP